MTASSDSSPALPIAPASGNSHTGAYSDIEPDSGGPLVAKRPPKWWLGLIGLALLMMGVGFALWRAVASRGGPGMMGPPAFPVKVERLQEASLEDSSEFVGTLDSQAGVSLQPEADGRVVQIFVSSGDTVAAGDPIMQLSSQRSQSDYNAALANISGARSARDAARAQLRAAQERQAQLEADLTLQDTEFDRTATLVEQGALAQERLDQVSRDRTVANSALNSATQEIAALASSLEGAEATLAQTQANANAIQQDLFDRTVTAPVSGIVGDIPIKLGDYVTAGTQLATITQNQDLELEIAAPIGESSRLRPGLPVELTLFGSDEAIATGNISFVSPTTDAATQTVLAKARFSQPKQPVQDDQRLEVRVIWDERPGILIPTTAVSRIGGQTFVFMPEEPEPPAEGEGPPGGAPGGAPAEPPGGPGAGSGSEAGPPPKVAKLHQVTLGDLQGNEYQVLEGLNPGDTVITSGLLNLRDGVPVMVLPEGEAPPTGGPGGAP